MTEREEILKYLSNNKELFRLQLNIVKLGLFGSFARNEQTETSDIDIIIEMPRGSNDVFEKKEMLKGLLSERFHRNVDICRERSIKPLFKEMILNDVIYV